MATMRFPPPAAGANVQPTPRCLAPRHPGTPAPRIAPTALRSPAFCAGLKAGDQILEVNAQSFLPSIGLKDAIAALTEPDVLMITALIGGKVPKHLFMTDRMESVAPAATAKPRPGAAAGGGGGGGGGGSAGGARNSAAAVTKQVLNRDATFGSHASSLQSARMAGRKSPLATKNLLSRSLVDCVAPP